MVLIGQSGVIWAGWLTGIILLRKPCGRPKLPSWYTWSLLLPILNLLLIIFVLLDALINWRNELFSRYSVSDTQIIYVLSRLSLLEQFITNFSLRLVFLCQAKNLSKIWCYLYHLNENEFKRSKSYMGNCRVLIFSLLFVTVVASTVIATLDAIYLGEYYSKSWLPINKWVFTILLFFALNAALVWPFSIALTSYLTTQYLIGKSFAGVCKNIHHLMDVVAKKQSESINLPTPPMSPEPEEIPENLTVVTNKVKNEINEFIEMIEKLFKLAKRTLPVILILVMAGGTHRLISLFVKIFMRVENTFWETSLVIDVAHLWIIASQLSILHMGRRLAKTILHWKQKLHTTYQSSISELADSVPSTEILNLKEIYKKIDAWTWKLVVDTGAFCRDVGYQISFWIIFYLLFFTLFPVPGGIINILVKRVNDRIYTREDYDRMLQNLYNNDLLMRFNWH